MITTSNQFANALKEYENKPTQSFRMATISSIEDGKVYCKMYGEDEPREKSYKRLSSYTPVVGDTVLCAVLNGSYTILGKVVQ